MNQEPQRAEALTQVHGEAPTYGWTLNNVSDSPSMAARSWGKGKADGRWCWVAVDHHLTFGIMIIPIVHDMIRQCDHFVRDKRLSLRDEAAELRGELVALRRELHQIPDIGLNLPRTQERALAALGGLPLEISTGNDLSWVTAVLRGGAATPDGAPGPVVLLRGDMDGLPVAEVCTGI